MKQFHNRRAFVAAVVDLVQYEREATAARAKDRAVIDAKLAIDHGPVLDGSDAETICDILAEGARAAGGADLSVTSSVVSGMNFSDELRLQLGSYDDIHDCASVYAYAGNKRVTFQHTGGAVVGSNLVVVEASEDVTRTVTYTTETREVTFTAAVDFHAGHPEHHLWRADWKGAITRKIRNRLVEAARALDAALPQQATATMEVPVAIATEKVSRSFAPAIPDIVPIGNIAKISLGPSEASVSFIAPLTGSHTVSELVVPRSVADQLVAVGANVA